MGTEHTGFRGPSNLLLSALAWTGLVLAGSLPAAGQTPSTAAPAATPQYRQVVNQYCITCHNERLKTADLVLEGKDVQNPIADAVVWEKVIRKLRARLMPPAGLPRPERSRLR